MYGDQFLEQWRMGECVLELSNSPSKQTKMKKSILILFIALTGILASCGTTKKATTANKSETVTIQTSAQCSMCKKTIEEGINLKKGVKKASLDMETMVLHVDYNPAKTNPTVIRQAVSKLGYDADDIPADVSVYEKLPRCCQKDGGH